MSIYCVTGTPGNGKTLLAVRRIRDYIDQGRRVATNLDLNMENLAVSYSKQSPVRLPDKPRAIDFINLGTGDGNRADDNQSYDESKFGLIVLDECITFLNSRDKKDTEIQKILDFMVQSRKNRWDVIFIGQHHESIDSQIRKNLFQYLVKCQRMDAYGVPFITPLVKLFGIKLNLPKSYLAKVRVGMAKDGIKVDSWFTFGKDIYNCYRTGQIFTDDNFLNDEGEFIDMRSSYCMLSAWHLKGRYLKPKQNFIIQFLKYSFFKAAHFVARTKSVSDEVVLQQWRLIKNKNLTPNSYLVNTVMNESEPLLINPDNLYLFPETVEEGLPWKFVKQAD